MEAIGEKIGLHAEFSDTSFDTIFRDLQAGQVRHRRLGDDDHAENAKKRSTSPIPYYHAEQSILVKKGSDLDSVDEPRTRKIAVQQGTTGAGLAEEKTDAAGPGPTRGTGRVQRAEGRQVEAVIIDFPVAADAVEEPGSSKSSRRSRPKKSTDSRCRRATRLCSTQSTERSAK